MRDDRGAPVAAPLPASWTRTPVTDAEQPCPACEGTAWDEVLPTDDSRGGRLLPDGRTEPTPIVVCRSCGHEVRIGATIRFHAPDDADPDEVAKRIRRANSDRRAHAVAVLAQVAFPIYAAADLPCQYAGHGASDGATDRVTVAHGDADWSTDPQLQIETSARSDRRSDSELVRAALARWLWDPTDIDTESDAAVALQFRARVHDQRRRAAQAPMSDRDIRVEGTPQPFRYVETEGRWAAVRRTATRTITVTGRGISPDALDLIPVAAPFRDLLAAEQ